MQSTSSSIARLNDTGSQRQETNGNRLTSHPPENEQNLQLPSTSPSSPQYPIPLLSIYLFLLSPRRHVPIINNQDMRAASRRHVIRPRSNDVFNDLYIIHIAIIPDPPATSSMFKICAPPVVARRRSLSGPILSRFLN